MNGLNVRDHQVIALLGEHQAASAQQLARVFFPTLDRARHRLVLLVRRDVLTRFRSGAHPGPGSLPWVYALSPLGAYVHAIDTGAPFPKPAEVRRRANRLRRSRTLDHLMGVVEFFTRLAGGARDLPGAALDEWWPQARAARKCGGWVRPDGYAIYRELGPHGQRTIGFFYEHDRATEELETLLGKLDRYATAAASGITWPVLIELTSARREANLHHAIRARYGPHGLSFVPLVATTTTTHTTGRLGPAGAIWWPAGTTPARQRLASLAGPPPPPRPWDGGARP
jgi:hypothetical protein